MKILNMAHGEFFILGAYVVLWITTAGANFWLGVAAAPVILGAFGFALQKGLLRFLQRDPIAAILVTWGLGMIIRQSLQIIMGPRPYSVSNPFPGSVSLFGVAYPAYRIAIIAIGVVIVLAVLWLYMKTSFGLQIRATIHNRQMAAALGINTGRINAVSFVTGSALAGLAGALLSPLIPIGPLMGLHYLIKCFFVVIVGGAGHLIGTVVGGFVIGGGESIFQFAIDPVLAEILIFLVALVIITIRPKGLIRV